MHWIAELSDGTKMLVPSEAKDSTENILRYGLKALLRRMLRNRNYISLVGQGVKVVKFINTRTGEEVPFNGTHAGFTDLFSALMEEKCKKVFYYQVQFLIGAKNKTEQVPLDFEGSVLSSVRSKMAELGDMLHFEIIGKKSFVAVEKIDNHVPQTPFLIEHHFIFEE